MVRKVDLCTDPRPAVSGAEPRFADESTSPSFAAPLVAGLPPGTLYQDETVLVLAKPSILFIFITSLRFCLVVVLLAYLLVNLTAVVEYRSVLVASMVLVLGRLVWALLVWTSHIYILTDQRIITIKGVLNVAIFQANLRKIQRTTLYEPLYQRLLGLGTLGFATAAAVTSYDSTWLMIPHPGQTHEQIVAAIHRVQ